MSNFSKYKLVPVSVISLNKEDATLESMHDQLLELLKTKGITPETKKALYEDLLQRIVNFKLDRHPKTLAEPLVSIPPPPEKVAKKKKKTAKPPPSPKRKMLKIESDSDWNDTTPRVDDRKPLTTPLPVYKGQPKTLQYDSPFKNSKPGKKTRFNPDDFIVLSPKNSPKSESVYGTPTSSNQISPPHTRSNRVYSKPVQSGSRLSVRSWY